MWFNKETKNKHDKDYSWQKSKKNPYKKDSNSSLNWKIILSVILSIFVVGVIGYFLLFHQFFLINQIKVNGVERIKKKDFKNSIRGIYSYNKFFVFPANNYFLLDKKELKQILKQKYPLEGIKIRKKLPNIIEVKVEEKISTIIYDNGKKYATVGLNGKVIKNLRKVGQDEWNVETKVTKKTLTSSATTTEVKKETVTSSVHTPEVKQLTKKQGKFPILYDKRGKIINKENKILSKAVVEGVTKWYQLLNNRSNLSFNYGRIDTNKANLVIYTDQIQLKVNTNKNKVESQFNKLTKILNNKIKKPTRLNYIDLRYENKVYWK